MNHPAAYRKKFGILRNTDIRAEIASRDAATECQRIVHLLACYEFPFDITRSLELALFHTYGSVSISRLLDATGEFRRLGQKRYDDTRLLISHFLEEGYDSEHGRRALERINAIHGNFRIPNEDYLFVLSTFISHPIAWVRQYGHRPFTPHEEEAWFNFFHAVGERLGIRDIPSDWRRFQAWVRDYEAAHLLPAESNRRVAEATLRVFEAWFPRPLKSLVRPVVTVLIRRELREAFGFEAPSRAVSALVRTGLWLRKQFMRLFNLERHPRLIANTRNRTYPGNRYTIDRLAPSYLSGEADHAALPAAPMRTHEADPAGLLQGPGH